MARYTAEEASEFLMNHKNFGEMESADSLDDSFSDSITSYSEVDSDPENDFIGRNVSVTAQQERGRPRTRGLQIRGRVRRRGGSFKLPINIHRLSINIWKITLFCHTSISSPLVHQINPPSLIGFF